MVKGALLAGASAAGALLVASRTFVPSGVAGFQATAGASGLRGSSAAPTTSCTDGSSLSYCSAAAAMCMVAGAAASKKSRAASVTGRAAKGGEELDAQVKKLYDESRVTGNNINGYLDPDMSGGLITGFALEFGPIGKMKKEAMDPFASGLVGSELAGFGGAYKFDPLGFSARWPEHLAWYREAELKHGRVAMMAFVGLLAPDVVRIPIEPCTDPSLNFANAHNELIQGLGFGPMWWLLTAVGVLESQRFSQLGKGFEDLTLENAGDLGLFKLPEDEEQRLWMQMAELKNGRLAMMAVSGIFTAGILWKEYHFPFYPFN